MFSIVLAVSSFTSGDLGSVHPDKNATHGMNSIRLSFDRFFMRMGIKNKELLLLHNSLKVVKVKTISDIR